MEKPSEAAAQLAAGLAAGYAAGSVPLEGLAEHLPALLFARFGSWAGQALHAGLSLCNAARRGRAWTSLPT